MKNLILFFILSSTVFAGHEAGANGDRISAWFSSLIWQVVTQVKDFEKKGGKLSPACRFFKETITANFLGASTPSRILLASDRFMIDPDGISRDVRTVINIKDPHFRRTFLKESVWRPLYEKQLPDFRLVFLSLVKEVEDDIQCAREFPLDIMGLGPFSDRLMTVPMVPDPQIASTTYLVSKYDRRVKRNALREWFRSLEKEMIAKMPQIREQDALFSRLKIERLQYAANARIVLVGDDDDDTRSCDLHFAKSADKDTLKAFGSLVKLSGNVPVVYVWAPTWGDYYLNQMPDYRMAFHTLLIAASYQDQEYGYSSRLPLNRVITTPFYDRLVYENYIRLPDELTIPYAGENGAAIEDLKTWYRDLNEKTIAYVASHPAILSYQHAEAVTKLRKALAHLKIVFIGRQDEDLIRNDDGEIVDIRVKFYFNEPTVYLRLTTWQEMNVSKKPDYRLVFHALLYAAGFEDSSYYYSYALPTNLEETK